MSKKLYQWLGALVITASLTACSDEITSVSTTEEAAATTQTTTGFSVSDLGLGTITTATPFNIHDVTLAFPNYSVVEELNFQEGKQYPIISVSKGAKTLFTINPTLDLKSIYSVVVEDNLINNSLNHRLGTLFSDIYADENKVFKCQAGVEEMSGKVLCLAPKASKLLYQFAGTWSGPDAQLPPTEVLSRWALETIIWKP
ncbi:DUF1131 family protein [Leucothrix arctica]|nr:DUF1131 family protein [Leucothrix arctica]